jgi:hypothetical protein
MIKRNLVKRIRNKSFKTFSDSKWRSKNVVKKKRQKKKREEEARGGRKDIARKDENGGRIQARRNETKSESC